MLRWRLISAAIILALVLGLLALDFWYPPVSAGQVASGLWLMPLLVSLVLLAGAELVALVSVELAGEPPLRVEARRAVVYAGILLVVIASCMPITWPLAGKTYPADCPIGTAGWPLAALFAATAAVVVAEMRAFRSPGQSLVRTSLSIFCIMYVGLFSSYLVQLRLLYDHAWGMAALLSMLVVVKMSDVGAYGTGRLLGRHKVFPKLSPGKTVEGVVGGLLTAAVVAWLFGGLLVPWVVEGQVGRLETRLLPAARWVVYGLVVAVFGIVGDLTVSLLKRDVGRKDSGRWLPGLGGALDVVDSVFMAAPPAFFCWVLGLVGPGS